MAALLALAAGCADDGTSEQPGDVANNDGNGGKEDNGGGDEQSLCVGVRGNGARIFAHFGGLALIHEHYGPIDGIAGGSSGSISSFLTESIYANPHVRNCGGKTCDDRAFGARAALLYKSIEGYLMVMANSEEVQAIQLLIPLATQAQQLGLDEMLANGQIEEARQALLTLFQSEDLKDLINPELIDLLANSPDPQFHIEDIWGSIKSFGSFAVDNDRLFVRPGLIDFEAFADKIGRVGSFYAAYGPANADTWTAFLDGCAEQGRERNWREVMTLDAGDGNTCGDHFAQLLTTWRTDLLVDEASYDSRINDPIGLYLPALISTSVLQGDAVNTFKNAREAYTNAQPYTWDINFDDVRFGYWGTNDDLNRVAANPQGFADDKTARFLPLGQDTWRKALSLSPAEPGLTRALEINDTLVSAGGWSDLAPTLVLKNMGCDKVALVTRQGDVRGFGPAVARLLGMTPDQENALYDLTDFKSGVTTSLDNSNATLCTNWDGFTDAQFSDVFDDAYTSPLESTDDFFTDNATPYSFIKESVELPGCSPGVLN